MSLLNIVKLAENVVTRWQLNPRLTTISLLFMGWCILVRVSPMKVAADTGWTRVGFGGMDVRAVAGDPIDSTKLYAGVLGQGVYTSTDSGQTWVLASTGLTDTQITALGVNPISSTVLFAGTANTCTYKSVDGAASWTDMTGCSMTWNNNMVLAYAFSHAAPDTVYTAVNTGIEQSADGGKTWMMSTIPYDGGLSFTVLTHPISPMVVFARNSAHVYRTANGGDTWITRDYGLEGLTIQSLAIAPSMPTILYAGTYEQGVFRSEDEGKHWANAGLSVNGGNIYHVTVDPFFPTVVYASMMVGYPFTATSNFYMTSNGGASWQPINTGFGDPTVGAIYITSTNPRVVYLGTNDGLFAKPFVYGQVYLPLLSR